MFQYAVTIVLNHEKIKRIRKRPTKIRPFINKYNWAGIFYKKKDDCKKFEKYNVELFLNILYAKKGKIYLKFPNINQIVKKKLFF